MLSGIPISFCTQICWDCHILFKNCEINVSIWKIVGYLKYMHWKICMKNNPMWKSYSGVTSMVCMKVSSMREMFCRKAQQLIKQILNGVFIQGKTKTYSVINIIYYYNFFPEHKNVFLNVQFYLYLHFYLEKMTF